MESWINIYNSGGDKTIVYMIFQDSLIWNKKSKVLLQSNENSTIDTCFNKGAPKPIIFC